MNLVGKIFVVLILVMSLVFMGFAVAVYATHKNWRDAIERTESSQVRLQSLEGLLTTARQERDQLQNESALLKQSERQAVQATKTAQDMLDAALARIDKLQTDIFEAYKERDTTFKNAVALTDQVIEKESEVERLKANKLSLLATMAQLKTAAEKLGVNINASVDHIPPRLDGKVLASRSNGLVEISLGSDDGIQRGHEAFISRDHAGQSKFVAKIEIVTTTPEKSVGKVIPSYKKGPIERGDRVVTKLP
jgi:hypothetical protein